jgi:hypothetical protein
MSQTAPQSLPFAYGWWSFDLGQYRPCDGTYCYYPYDSLPPIPEAQFTGSLQWLEQADGADEPEMHLSPEDEALPARLSALTASAQQLGLTLPEAFLRLMASPALRDRIPSCTACYFDLSKKIVPCPGSEAGYIIRFLNDQQDVLSWYLYLTTQGEHCVLVSPYELDKAAEEEEESKPLTEQQRRSIIANTLICAPSFEGFVYRFWLENVLWFKLNEDGGSLSEAQQQYLAHSQANAGEH